MDFAALFPNPAFSKFKFSPKLDFIKVFSPGPGRITRPDSRYWQEADTVDSEVGVAITVQDPKRGDIVFLQAAVPGAKLIAVETSIDLTPKKALTGKSRSDLLLDLFEWIVSRLYPWKGAGIQVRSGVSADKGDFTPVFEKMHRRRPAKNETLYLGHSNSRYADASQANFASMRVYIKVKDRGKRLPESETRTRMEVTLTTEGCRHFGLISPSDLIGFRFRRLGHYFLFAKPRIVRPGMAGLSKRDKERANLIKAWRELIPIRLITDVGMHALSDADPKVVTRITGDGPLNERVLLALDNLSKHYRAR